MSLEVFRLDLTLNECMSHVNHNFLLWRAFVVLLKANFKTACFVFLIVYFSCVCVVIIEVMQSQVRNGGWL